MKPTDRMEELIRTEKSHIATTGRMDKRVLDDSFAAMEETILAKSAGYKPNLLRTIIKSRITKFVAAAVVILVVGVFIVQRRADERTQNGVKPEVAKSPAEMMTAISLNMAYRRGGMEEVDRQCDKAFEMLGPRPGRITVQEILAEFNGT